MTSPPGATARAAPGSRGALRNVFTTVASPNVSPASHHLVIVSRMSRTAPPRSLTFTTTLLATPVARHDALRDHLSKPAEPGKYARARLRRPAPSRRPGASGAGGQGRRAARCRPPGLRG